MTTTRIDTDDDIDAKLARLDARITENTAMLLAGIEALRHRVSELRADIGGD